MGGNIITGTEVTARGDNPTSVPVFLIFLAISALLFLTPSPVKASEDGEWDFSMENMEFDDGFLAAMAVMYLSELTLDVTSLVFAVGNLAYASSDKRPSSTWINGGYVCGGLNITEGIIILAIFGSQDGSDELIGLGIAHLILGAANIGLSLWSSSKPSDDQPHISLSPMILVDRDGSPAVGVGLQVVNW